MTPRRCFSMLFFIFFLFSCFSTKAITILYAALGVNGLTCSQCSRSVEMKLRKLAFVKDVSMDLEHTSGTIYFKENRPADFNSIAKAVTDAGFSVRFLKIAVIPGDMQPQKGSCYVMDGNAFQLLGPLPAKDTLQLQLLGSNFMPAPMLKKWKSQLVNKCGAAQVYFITAN